jgi:hypothetical protein
VSRRDVVPIRFGTKDAAACLVAPELCVTSGDDVAGFLLSLQRKMGARLSRAQAAASKIAGVPKQPPTPTPSSPVRRPSSKDPLPPQPLVRVPGNPSPSASQQPQPGASVSGEDWGKLLSDISGSISSSTWEGTVGVRGAALAERDSSWHAAQQSRSMRAKLPKRQRGPSPISEGEAAGCSSAAGRGDALAEISAAFDEDVQVEAEARRGRMNQNQLLDLFHLRREEPDKWQAAELGSRYDVPEEDIRNLLRYSRTVLAKEVSGMTRGVADPGRGILRFEDQHYPLSAKSRSAL